LTSAALAQWHTNGTDADLSSRLAFEPYGGFRADCKRLSLRAMTALWSLLAVLLVVVVALVGYVLWKDRRRVSVDDDAAGRAQSTKAARERVLGKGQSPTDDLRRKSGSPEY
jgi:hypothetical protein